MTPELGKIEQVYDHVAHEYADAFSGEHEKKPKDQEILRRFAREIGDKKTAWDFGCGPGQTTKFLHDLGVEISGLDLSEKLLHEARSRHPGINFQKGNMLALEFESNAIAGIVAFYAIVHFTREQAEIALRETFRVLQPGGLFLFTFHIGDGAISIKEFLGRTIDIDLTFFTTEYISRCLTQIGFTKTAIIERDPYPGIEYESRRAYVFATKPR